MYVYHASCHCALSLCIAACTCVPLYVCCTYICNACNMYLPMCAMYVNACAYMFVLLCVVCSCVYFVPSIHLCAWSECICMCLQVQSVQACMSVHWGGTHTCSHKYIVHCGVHICQHLSCVHVSVCSVLYVYVCGMWFHVSGIYTCNLCVHLCLHVCCEHA